jgi:hypothetical protein
MASVRAVLEQTVTTPVKREKSAYMVVVPEAQPEFQAPPLKPADDDRKRFQLVGGGLSV